jgi:hypothetical protein
MQAFWPDSQRGKSWVHDHADQTVEVEEHSDPYGGYRRSGPHERGLAVNVQTDDFAAGSQVHTGANCLLPSISLQPSSARRPTIRSEVASQGRTAGSTVRPPLPSGLQSAKLNRAGASAHTLSPTSRMTPTS